MTPQRTGQVAYAATVAIPTSLAARIDLWLRDHPQEESEQCEGCGTFLDVCPPHCEKRRES